MAFMGTYEGIRLLNPKTCGFGSTLLILVELRLDSHQLGFRGLGFRAEGVQCPMGCPKGFGS